MDIIKPRTLSGFMELLPGKQVQFERMADTIRTTYASYGFAPLDTPAIEDAQILLAKGGGDTEKQIYRFQKGDSDLALRFDLTVPLAKYVALHYNELAFPFRRFQISISAEARLVAMGTLCLSQWRMVSIIWLSSQGSVVLGSVNSSTRSISL